MSETEPIPRRPGRRRRRGPNGERRFTVVPILMRPPTVAELDRLVELEDHESRSALVRLIVEAHLRKVARRAAAREGDPPAPTVT